MKISKLRRIVRPIAKASNFVDYWMTWGASYLRMCGEGVKNNWATLVSRFFYTECHCCMFFRGVTVGAVLILSLTIPIVLIF